MLEGGREGMIEEGNRSREEGWEGMEVVREDWGRRER